MATLTHTPEQCGASKEHTTAAAEGERWVKEMRNSAKKLGVKVHRAYLCKTEHTFYFVLESDSYGAVSSFLGPPILTYHTGRISPVMTVEEAFGLPSGESRRKKQ